MKTPRARFIKVVRLLVCLLAVVGFVIPTTVIAENRVIETATLTVNYRIKTANGNMIASPYIAEMPKDSL